MFFRFAAAIVLIVLIALIGTTLEKRNLDLKRAISQQQYRQEALLDTHVRLRLEAQRLGTPARLLGPLERGELRLQRPEKPARSDERRTPLQNWNSAAGTKPRG
jgi:hypothetical protein